MKSKKILLKEYFELKPSKSFLSEAKKTLKEGGPLIVKGVIQRANSKNQNDRIYPRSILQREMDKYYKEFIKRGIGLGELDHRDEPVIALSNVSHRVVSVDWDGDDVRGEVEILKTPKGKIAQELVLAGVPLGISSRAVGSVTQNESEDSLKVVNDDLQLICFDLVGTPSTHEAFLHPEEPPMEAMDISLESLNLTEEKNNEDNVRKILEELLRK